MSHRAKSAHRTYTFMTLPAEVDAEFPEGTNPIHRFVMALAPLGGLGGGGGSGTCQAEMVCYLNTRTRNLMDRPSKHLS